MRINTNGEKEYRTDLYERTAERFTVSTKKRQHRRRLRVLNQMLRNLERAVECTQYCRLDRRSIRLANSESSRGDVKSDAVLAGLADEFG